MDIEYAGSKEVQCYGDFVLNPENRAAARNFTKMFGANLMGPAKKLHDRLSAYESAGAYNKEFGRTDNRIEIKQGELKKEALILKVRIAKGYRKFFNSVTADGSPLKVQDWRGGFDEVRRICVIAVNNHEYKKV